MKLIRTELKRNFEDMSDRVDEVVKEALTVLDVLIEIKKVCVPESEYIEKYGEPDEEFGYHQLNVMDEVTALPELSNLKLFCDSLSCKDIVLNRRLKDFFVNYNLLLERIDEAMFEYIPLTLEEVNKIKYITREAIGNLSVCIYYQFSMDETIKSIANLEELVADVNLYKYVEANSLDLSKLVVKIKESWLENKPSLPIFEEYPDLEEMFYELAGAYIQDFDALEDYITIDDIFMIVNSNNLDIEGKIKEIENRGKKGTNKLSAF